MNVENVKLVELNEENWYECCELELTSEQEGYMESNAVSIAQSKFVPTLKPYAIYFEDRVVGFLMYNTVKEELDGHWVYRIMVDKEFQGKGIGRAATKLMILEIEKMRNAEKIVVGYHPMNPGAHKLYSSLGFVDNGDRFGKEMAVVKYINQ
ncbi:GNAT family N-acetyltransferase [Halobacillus yeomjeoni]|uniref:GNAT family N-acetyltransferase n=1 Tax=Halobacillus yeomjeoni TaxID=311194 RepID=UPI001CD779AA|nr:GNAT family N-acetyltransferase [Halobacillus yeomjeoni]MCA0984350.1 GNAT family N-acetyltransferase [Halobacillus yeomjeoni]